MCMSIFDNIFFVNHITNLYRGGIDETFSLRIIASLHGCRDAIHANR